MLKNTYSCKYCSACVPVAHNRRRSVTIICGQRTEYISAFVSARERRDERTRERRNNMRQQRFRGDPWLRYIILALTLGYKEYRQGGAADITLVAGRLVGNILSFFFPFLIYIFFPPRHIHIYTHTF